MQCTWGRRHRREFHGRRSVSRGAMICGFDLGVETVIMTLFTRSAELGMSGCSGHLSGSHCCFGCVLASDVAVAKERSK